MIQGGIPYGEYVLPSIPEEIKRYEFEHYKLPSCVREMYALRREKPTNIEGFLNVILSKELIDKSKKVEEVKEEVKENNQSTETTRRLRRSSISGSRTLFKSPFIQKMYSLDYGDEFYTVNPKTFPPSKEYLEKLIRTLDDSKITLEASLMYQEKEERNQYVEGKRALRKTLQEFKVNKNNL